MIFCLLLSVNEIFFYNKNLIHFQIANRVLYRLVYSFHLIHLSIQLAFRIEMILIFENAFSKTNIIHIREVNQNM